MSVAETIQNTRS